MNSGGETPDPGPETAHAGTFGDDTSEEIESSVAPHVRRLRQRALSDRLRESLLFLPAVLLAGAVLVEEVAAAVDRRVRFGFLSAFDLAPDTAVTLLSTIAGATITTAGVVFSLLVVSLQLASGQFSPRVLRTFWRDRFGQVLIGLLLATFAFCVLALTQVDPEADTAPTLTMLLAQVLALASVLVIVAYLNRITRQQYVGRIVERITEEGLSLVTALPTSARIGTPVPVPDTSRLGAPLVVRAHTNGWIQQVSHQAVLGAVPPGSVVRLETRVGAFLVRDEPLATIWPRPDRAAAAESARLIGEAVIAGATRTMQQDIDFALRQLNDIALRALSPAVNDPTTAIEVILRACSLLRPLLLADLPAQCVRDDQGRVLLTPWDLDHAEYVDHAFDQLRVYAAPHAQVVLALVRGIRMLRRAAVARGARDEAVAALDRQLDYTLDGAVKAALEPADLAEIRAAASG